MIVSKNPQYPDCVGDFDGKEKIRCIFLSEFHPTVGSKISVQFPLGFLSKEVFDLLNVFIIPKVQLQRCIISLNTLGYKIVGFPVKIDHHKYARNVFIFNLCLICDASYRSVQYEAVVKKLAESFLMMEDESGFLSKEENKPRIQNMLSKILKDLNEKQVSTIFEGENTIYLKIVKLQDDPPAVFDFQVPFIRPEYQNMDLEQWDLTTQQVLPYINGSNHIARIASEADVEIHGVKACVQNLVYYKILYLLPLFKYSNVYMCTRNLQNLTKDKNMGETCKIYVKLKQDGISPTLSNILQLYCQMTHGVTLRALCQRLSPREHNIDERKLVTFGLQHNLIRCINKYPIFTGSFPIGRQKLYSGLNSLDEICCKTGFSPSKLEQDLELDTNVTVILK